MRESRGPRARAFLGALALTFVCHALALLAMVAILAPGVDTHAPAAARAAWIAAHPGLWRLGWLPWQATAASDLVFGVALLGLARARADATATRAAVFAVAGTVLAVIPDQLGELLFDTSHVELARRAAADATQLEAFVRSEARSLELTGTCGGAGYTLMFLGWIVATARFARASTPRKRALFLAAGAISAVAFAASVWANHVSVAPATLARGYVAFDRVVALNVVGFGMLMVWFVILGFIVRDERAHVSLTTNDARAAM